MAMNTSGRKFNTQRCSKLGLTFLLLLPAMTTQYSTAKETTINQLPGPQPQLRM